MCYKHNQSVDIGEKLVSTRFELLKMATSHAFSVQHACGVACCGLLTMPTPLACADATEHAQTQCRKGSSIHRFRGL